VIQWELPYWREGGYNGEIGIRIEIGSMVCCCDRIDYQVKIFNILLKCGNHIMPEYFKKFQRFSLHTCAHTHTHTHTHTHIYIYIYRAMLIKIPRTAFCLYTK